MICGPVFFAGVAIVFFATTFLIYEYWRADRPRRLLLPIGVMVVVLVGLLGATGYFWPTSANIVP